MVQATDGDFYGTTEYGGAYRTGFGTMFSLSTGLGPFVETQTAFGKVASTVLILGTDLAGASSVSIGGTAEAFKVVSSLLIKTTVPSGAKTREIQAVTPNGTLSSNVPFEAVP